MYPQLAVWLVFILASILLIVRDAIEALFGIDL